MIEIEYYRKENGSCPFEEFVDGLPEKVQYRIMESVDTLAEGGPLLREPLSKPVGDGLFELRIISGRYASRVLYFFVYGGRAVITNGFLKKSQKTPRTELQRARRYRKDWMVRYG